jgi:hypothetical protein
MEIMQGYIDYIFYEVWCKADGKDYDIENLFAEYDELLQMLIELDTSVVKGAVFFLTGLQQVFEDFKLLSPADILQLTKWYDSNNQFEKLCDNDPTVTPATYKIITIDYPDLSNHLHSFFKNLYSQSFLALKSVSSRIGHIDDHYKKFVTANSKGKCPFCGMYDIKGLYHTKREAYDHYLPKSKYPFISINFRNLAPACHECNSTYKHTQDPAFIPKSPVANGGGNRRKSFYPYTSTGYEIEINLEVKTADWRKLKPEDIDFSFGPNGLSEQIETWLDVYGIEERYKAKCSEENDGKYWLEQVFDEWAEDGKAPQDFLNTLRRHTKRKPYADENFLKLAFLEGCEKAGLFNV